MPDSKELLFQTGSAKEAKEGMRREGKDGMGEI
jgi:hypothetical protein